MVGDGATPGDAGSNSTPLTYGCYTGRLADTPDADGYQVYGVPVYVTVRILDAPDCVHVTWFRGPPPSDATSRWMCEGDSHKVGWSGVHPMRLQVWHGPRPAPEAPTDYLVLVAPAG